VTPLELVLSHLPDARKNGSGFVARCPAHEDRHASLSIGVGDDAKVLIKCFVGCPTETVLARLGLQLRDLFVPRRSERPPRSKKGGRGHTSPPNSDEHSNGLTLARYAESKRLDLEFLRREGLSDVHYQSLPAVKIPYLDADGGESAVRFRLALDKAQDGADQRFRWRKGSKPLLYGLPRLSLARRARWVLLVEGESDAHTAWSHGIPALGVPGASMWRDDWAAHFLGVDDIYAVREPDIGGDTFVGRLTKSPIADRVLVIDLAPRKDVSALHLDDPEQFAARLEEAKVSAVRLAELVAADRQREGDAAYETSAALLRDPELFVRVGEAMRAGGYAGDLRAPTLVYVAATSRLLERPQNLAVVSASASGKNRTIDAALELIPPDAVYIEAAGSARAVIYAEEHFEHRVVVFSEADSIPEDGPAASAVRSLAADNKLAYDVVEKNPQTDRFETRHIDKPGPTGLITTSTKSLGAQMGTRVLEVALADDPDQTRQVMRAHARAVMDNGASQPDLGPFLAMQRWLEVSGASHVTVPFAAVLADLVPPAAVRMRRDFRQLLTCIQAVALLHQQQRDRAADDSVIATLVDYAHARELLTPIFDAVIAEGLTNAVRETVEAVNPDEEVTEATLVTRLGLSKSTVSYRVGRAVSGGWLVNRETRKSHAARLARGAPLPGQVHALPTVDQVAERFEGSNEKGEEIYPSPPPSPRERRPKPAWAGRLDDLQPIRPGLDDEVSF